jgi:two-component system, NtrC family, nitrogen regulation response regulator GlnG
VMAPAQVVEPKDLPPELLGGTVPVPAPSIPAALPIDPGLPPAMPMPPPPEPVAVVAAVGRSANGWLTDLEREARQLLESGSPEVWDTLTRQFEGRLIHTALEVTRGRRIEAAQKLGIGRNTITRKIQELGLDD